MKRRWKITFIVLAGVSVISAALLIAPALVLSLAFSDMCRSEPVAEYPSPDRSLKVVVFQRDCGATTGFSTQASLLPAKHSVPDSDANLFVADADHGRAPTASWGGPGLEVRWQSSRVVVLRHHPLARVFKAEPRIRGIEVQYDRVP